MRESKIKVGILKALLDSPKTTGELAKSLGYVDEKGHGRYNVIIPDLNTLQSYGFIQCEKIKKKGMAGPTPTTYNIVYEISVLKQILKQYPSISPYMQKNIDVARRLAELVAGPDDPDTSELMNADKECILTLMEDNVYNNLCLEVVKFITTSPAFFELCMEYDYEALKKRGEKIYRLSNEGLAYTSYRLNHRFKGDDSETPFEYPDLLEYVYQHCVLDDILKGRVNPEAENYINALRKEQREHPMNFDKAVRSQLRKNGLKWDIIKDP